MINTVHSREWENELLEAEIERRVSWCVKIFLGYIS